ncbi:trypsin-like peptidase domain-containing protein [Planktothrix sp. FACHB-1355]|uniref:Trypsin-like peptidase domain-containing protein n=1 Tax=Aerosakkonema funiforme FACHB-1375 TaxID=2949571 RepID=A0A926VI43_9CYAN|nr:MULTISPECIES: trypsin-like peptidase domain-containing protein [Oscillatoriales]MBD2183558.1 trypsin-like peptidase domain-containing protein [Aerosakkonema funiforme FACHB-1375]MBD3560843.1 trypsin-like peptidase domain-containing protein [Planktothrix sp. FACHB-1355]
MNSFSLVEELNAVTESLRRSTVKIRGRRNGIGSGVIWNSDGIIITNAHVISHPKISVELSDGRILAATAIAKNRQRDLAALKVDASNLNAAKIGNGDRLRVGELVVAVGNPNGSTGAVTVGIIHNLTSINVNRPNWIQTDVQLAPGNSGGPLANVQGEVIGINTMIVQGKGFAIPTHVVQRFLERGNERPYLGVSLREVIVPLQGKPSYGLLITDVESGSPADIGQLMMGDVLVGVRGIAFLSPNELFHILENSYEGDGLPLNVLRGDKLVQLDVVLWNKDSSARAA